MVTTSEKQLMVVGIDESENSFYALKWVLDRFFVPYPTNPPFKLLVLHAKPLPTSVVRISGPGLAEVLPIVQSDLKRKAAKIVAKAKELCQRKSVDDVIVEVVEGDARNVLCETVEKRHASMLVVGSHGYGAMKRAVLGSVSDYCTHHAHCTVMIVKNTKAKK